MLKKSIFKMRQHKRELNKNFRHSQRIFLYNILLKDNSKGCAYPLSGDGDSSRFFKIYLPPMIYSLLSTTRIRVGYTH